MRARNTRTRGVGLALAIMVGMTGCARSASPTSRAVSTPRPKPAASAIIVRDERTLLAASYTVHYHSVAKMRDGTVLLIFHSVCTGSADGHCQAIDIFKGDGTRPILQTTYTGVLAIATLPDGFSVKAVSYAPRDPLCCPSLPPVTDIYAWMGKGFVERGPRPRSPGT